MQRSYAEAIVNRQNHTVYGRRLHPFCLNDLLFLSFAENPAYFSNECAPEDLMAAVLVCSSDVRDLKAGKGSLGKWREGMWLRAASWMPFGREFTKFKAYLADYDSRPEFAFSATQDAECRAPGPLAMACYIERHSNMRHEEIMAAPIGEMFWRQAAIAEIMGHTSAKLLTQEEVEFAALIESEGGQDA